MRRIIKKFQKKFHYLIYPAIFLLIVLIVYAASIYRVNRVTTATINEHGVCKQVSNSGPADLFVPTATSTEWSRFYNSPPPGVSICGCSGGRCPCLFQNKACRGNVWVQNDRYSPSMESCRNHCNSVNAVCCEWGPDSRCYPHYGSGAYLIDYGGWWAATC